MGAAALGIRNLLLLKGDDPKQGDQPDAKPVFDYDTAALTAVAVAIRDKDELPTGKKVGGHADFFIAAADVPIDPPAGWEPKSLKAKIAAGCEFVQTQFCMDAAVVRRYMARLAEHGVKVPFLIGISPIRSAKSARWMREKLFGTIIPDAIVARLEAAADPVAEGRKLCIDLMRELATIPGVAGVHIMAPGNEAAMADVIKDASVEPLNTCARSTGLGTSSQNPRHRHRHCAGPSARCFGCMTAPAAHEPVTTAPASPGPARTARAGSARRSRRRSRWRSRPPPAGSTARRRRSAAGRDG